MRFKKIGFSVVIAILLILCTGCANSVDDTKSISELIGDRPNQVSPIYFNEMKINDSISLYETETLLLKVFGQPLKVENQVLDEEAVYYYQMGLNQRVIYYEGLKLELMGDKDFKLVSYTITGNRYSGAKGIKIGMSLKEVLKLLPIDEDLKHKSISQLCENSTVLYDYKNIDTNLKEQGYNSFAYIHYDEDQGHGNRKNLLISDAYYISHLSFNNDRLVRYSGYQQLD